VVTDLRVREEYARWLLSTDADRVLYDLPTTKAGFASLKGVSTRTLRRWGKEEPFVAMLERFGVVAESQQGSGKRWAANTKLVSDADAGSVVPHDVRRRASQSPAAVTHVPGVVGGESASDLDDYVSGKRVLVKQMRSGDYRALDLYMKHWGRRFIEEEDEGPGSLGHMSDVELAEGVAARLSPDDWGRLVARRAAVA